MVITLGFVDSMKAFNLAYVGMVELYRGQYSDSDAVDGNDGNIIRGGHNGSQVEILKILTPKKALVDPQQNVPYLIFVCLARSSAEFTGDDIFDAVKKAATNHHRYRHLRSFITIIIIS